MAAVRPLPRSPVFVKLLMALDFLINSGSESLCTFRAGFLYGRIFGAENLRR
jgi:hypothetical protein